MNVFADYDRFSFVGGKVQDFRDWRVRIFLQNFVRRVGLFKNSHHGKIARGSVQHLPDFAAFPRAQLHQFFKARAKKYSGAGTFRRRGNLVLKKLSATAVKKSAALRKVWLIIFWELIVFKFQSIARANLFRSEILLQAGTA